MNTQELAPDRWLCPLSGKRFKGPEFIRKHLFYKHMEKIVEVKKDVEYFNNYIFDPKRPQLPEHPNSNKSAPGGGSTGPAQSVPQQTVYQPMQQAPQQGGFGGNAFMPSQMMFGGGGGGGMGRPGMNTWQQGYGGMPSGDFANGGYAGGGGGGYSGGFSQYQQGYRRPPFQAQAGGGFNGRRSGGPNNREMIQYKDLDAPDDN